MDASPGRGHENTPRFTLGHLCTGAALTRHALEYPDASSRDEIDVPTGYDALFRRQGPGDRRTPTADPSAPTREMLVREFERQHAALLDTLRRTDDDVLERPCPWKLGHLMPRHADLILFVCSHEGLHLGQLASWRRAMGLEAAMARMTNRPG